MIPPGGVRRACLFAAVGVVCLLHWVLADPSFEASETQDDWPYVVLFSASLLGIALALPMLGGLIGGSAASRASTAAAWGAALGAVANILEDGLHLGWAFWAFVLGSAALLIGLGALTVAIAAAGRGRRRLVAIVPAGTAAGIILYVRAGGPVLLGAWLIAALFALALSGSAELRAHPEEAEELVGHETPHPT